MSIKTIIELGVVLFLIPSLVYAGPGTSSLEFLKLPVCVRPLGMGEAFSAVADDPDALYWNPAGLVQLYDKQFTFVYNIHHVSIGSSCFTYAQPIGDFDAIGLSFLFLFDEEVMRDESGDRIGTFYNGDKALIFGYAHQIMPELLIGTNIKIFLHQLYSYDAAGYAFDGGMILRLLEDKSLKIALSLKNMGPPMDFLGSSEPLPFDCKLGLAYQPPDGSVILSSDINLNDPSLQLGLEYVFAKTLSLRMGYRTNTGYLGFIYGFTFGAGFKWENIGIDYAFAPYGPLGIMQTFSFTVSFGPPFSEWMTK